MWQGKGHPLRWAGVRQVAGDAVDEALQTHSLEQLLNIVKEPCRETALEAARNKRDENAQLKREYYNMVMDLIEGEYLALTSTTAVCLIANRRVQKRWQNKRKRKS